jgi:putative transposon-encoded protein
MSRKKPIEIELNRKLKIDPEFIFESEVVPGGNGAVIKAYKKFIGLKATVIIHQPSISEISTPESIKKYNDAEL